MSRVLAHPLRENLQYLTTAGHDTTSDAQPRAQEPSVELADSSALKALTSWSLLFVLPHTFTAPHIENCILMAFSLKQWCEKGAPEAKAVLAQEARGGHRHSRTLWPAAWAHSQPGLPSTIRCSALAQQLNHHISLGIKLGPEVCFCFSKVKCIGVTLIPGLSPTLHDITVSIWPVKTLALCPERFTDLRQSEEEFCSPWALLSKTAEF